MFFLCLLKSIYIPADRVFRKPTSKLGNYFATIYVCLKSETTVISMSWNQTTASSYLIFFFVSQRENVLGYDIVTFFLRNPMFRFNFVKHCHKRFLQIYFWSSESPPSIQKANSWIDPITICPLCIHSEQRKSHWPIKPPVFLVSFKMIF